MSHTATGAQTNVHAVNIKSKSAIRTDENALNVLQTLDIPAVQCNDAHLIFAANAAFAALVHLTPDECAGTYLEEWLHTTAHTANTATGPRYYQLFDDPENRRFRISQNNLDTYHLLSLIDVTPELQTIDCTTCPAIDDPDRGPEGKPELALIRNQARLHSQRLRLALEGARAGVFEYDCNENKYWASNQLVNLIGPEFIHASRYNPFAMFHDEDQSIAFNMQEEALNNIDPKPVDIRVKTENGLRWFRIYLEIVRDKLGNPSRQVGLLIDIHDQKCQELDLREARAQAVAATESKSNFLASVSHEIRTPLNGILGMARALLQHDVPQQHRDMVTTILDCGQTLMSLLNDVLDISKIEAGKLEITSAPGDLLHTLDRVKKLFGPVAEEKNLTLVFTQQPNMPTALEFDAVRVRQCVANLVSNAVKFTSKGHITVTTSVHNREDDIVTIAISVTDTGIGVDQETQSRLFQPFTQADSSISRKYGGSGLGLAIIRELTKLMDGTVAVNSTPGRGSTFTMTFKAKISDPMQAAAKQNRTRSDDDISAFAKSIISGRHMLLVDDNATNRQVIKLFLAPMGVTFTEAANGQEALTILNAEPGEQFSAILLDVHMPVMDGIETLHHIRSSGQPWSDIPVIALTADAMRGDRERFIELGMNNYVSKPIDPRELVTQLSVTLAPEAGKQENDDGDSTKRTAV